MSERFPHLFLSNCLQSSYHFPFDIFMTHLCYDWFWGEKLCIAQSRQYGNNCINHTWVQTWLWNTKHNFSFSLSLFFAFFPSSLLPPFFFLFLILGLQNSFEKGLSKVFARWKILEASKLSSKMTALDIDSLRSNFSVFSVVVKLKTSFKNNLILNSWETALAGYLQIRTNHPQI